MVSLHGEACVHTRSNVFKNVIVLDVICFVGRKYSEA